MTTESPSPEGILKDLQEIYLMALGKGQFSVAFKIKELLGREAGLFALRNQAPKENKISLDNLSDDDLNCLIKELEAKLTLDHRKSEE